MNTIIINEGNTWGIDSAVMGDFISIRITNLFKEGDEPLDYVQEYNINIHSISYLIYKKEDATSTYEVEMYNTTNDLFLKFKFMNDEALDQLYRSFTSIFRELQRLGD